jgi:mannosyltransferase
MRLSTARGPATSLSLWAGPILLLGMGLRFYQLAGQSLWSDEGNSVALARAGLAEIAARTALDIHPPLYYWLLHGWMWLTGDSEVAVRALSASASLLLVAVICRLGRRLFGDRASLVAAFAAAVSPFQVYYAQEARMYALLALLGGLTIWAAAEMAAPVAVPWRSWQRLRWVLLYILSAALGLYTHYAFPAIMAACMAAGLTYAWQTRRQGRATAGCHSEPERGEGEESLQPFLRRKPLSPKWPAAWATRASDSHSAPPPWMGAVGTLLLCQVVPLALYAPWLPAAWRQLTTWPAPATPQLADALLTIWRTLIMGPAGGHVETVWLIALGLLGLVGLARLVLRGSPSIVVLVLLYLGLPLGLTAALFKPAYLKFLLVATPAWCLLIAVAIAGSAARPREPAFWSARRAEARTPPGALPESSLQAGAVPGGLKPALHAIGLMAGCILLAAAAWSPLHTYYSDPHAARDDYRGIARYLAAVGGPQDAILLNAPGQQEVFGYYYRGEAPVYPLPRSRPLDAEATLAEMASILARSHTIYAVYWATDESDPQGVIEGWLEDHTFKAAESWVGNLRLATYAVPLPEEDWTPAGLRFGDHVTLSRYQVSYPSAPVRPALAKPGDIIQVQLQWQTDTPDDAHAMVFVQALDAANHLVGQRDVPLSRGGADRIPGQPLLNRLGLLIAPGTPPGEHRIIAGLYDAATGIRLPVQSAHTETPGDFATLGAFVVERPAAPLPLAAFRLRHPTDAAVGPLRLFGYDCYQLGHDSDTEAPLSPSTPLHIVLTWQAVGRLDQDWRVNLRLVSSAGPSPIVAEGVYPAAGVDYPPARWQPGEVVRAQYDLFVPSGATPGAYSVQLQLVDASGSPLFSQGGGLSGARSAALTVCPVRVK